MSPNYTCHLEDIKRE